MRRCAGCRLMHGRLPLRLRPVPQQAPRRALHPGWAACSALLLGWRTTPILLQPPAPAAACCGRMHHSSWPLAPVVALRLSLSLSPPQQAVLISDGHGVLVLQGTST